MRKMLITGAYGFMGRNLIRAWHQTHDIMGLDLPPELWTGASFDPFVNLVPIYHYDLQDEIYLVNNRLQGVDTVIHCANRARIQPSWEHYADYYNTNITATQRLFALCQKSGVKTFVYFSSSSVYGNSNKQTQSEDDALVPTNPYAVSKLAAEHALRVQALRGNTRLIVVRPFTMYGDFMNYGPHGLVIAQYLRALRDDKPLMLEGGGTQTRDFVHADDAVRALELILNHAEPGSVYNIGSGRTVAIKQLADCVSTKQIIAPHRIGAVQSTCADIAKLQQLGYAPQVDVVAWLTDRAEQYKLNLFKDKEIQ
jgi:UDP-glucose 4-epimerase